ncbi:MAG: hypothetical protein HND47_15090 [Chloroflexi bacterium]|nr:hypothetical protein [Chloroflexota bacterium]
MLPNDPQFQDLLLNYSQETNPTVRKQLEDMIWQAYGTENTVLVLDMFGFSLLTRKYGIVHYLSMIRRMQLSVEPIITGHGGTVIKFEADNCFSGPARPAGGGARGDHDPARAPHFQPAHLRRTRRARVHRN